MRLIQTILWIAVFTANAMAQAPAGAPQAERGGRGGLGAGVRSVEIAPDSRVTFRLHAPNANEVLLNGNWPGGRGMKMTKDASGVWSITTEPLKAESWVYRRHHGAGPAQQPGSQGHYALSELASGSRARIRVHQDSQSSAWHSRRRMVSLHRTENR